MIIQPKSGHMNKTMKEVGQLNISGESDIFKKVYEILYSILKKGFQNPNLCRTANKNILISPLFCLYIDRDDRGESKCYLIIRFVSTVSWASALNESCLARNYSVLRNLFLPSGKSCVEMNNERELNRGLGLLPCWYTRLELAAFCICSKTCDEYDHSYELIMRWLASLLFPKTSLPLPPLFFVLNN